MDGLTTPSTAIMPSNTNFHPLSQFAPIPDSPGPSSYWYQGHCPTSGQRLQLPRTQQIEVIAQRLLQQLEQTSPPPREGKMIGVLLVRTENGKQGVLKAFSGLLHGKAEQPGWVPMIPGRSAVAWEETRTLALLEEMKQDLIRLSELPARREFKALEDKLNQHLTLLWQRHRTNKAKRQQQRQEDQKQLKGQELERAMAQLGWQSQQDKRERRKVLTDFNHTSRHLQDEIKAADLEIQRIKKERKHVSRSLQASMQAVYQLTNFAGVEKSLRELLPETGIPTGTGECCAPKLLHCAATHHLKPLALAEFWYGPPPPDGSRQHGQFYGACAERCQPIMGFLLSGMTDIPPTPKVKPTLHIIYEDADLLVVDKPTGLLSVPGRYFDRQDSVVSRINHLVPEGQGVMAPHRLDQETSGLLLLAKSPAIHKLLSAQFQNRTIHKQYEALLHGMLSQKAGTIQLPLAPVPGDAPRQTVDYEQGKPSETHYRVIEQTPTTTRVRFTPITGRTHQLRVHAAHPDGLHAPILGDSLYPHPGDSAERLCLHACTLMFTHPATGQELKLVSNVPF